MPMLTRKLRGSFRQSAANSSPAQIAITEKQ